MRKPTVNICTLQVVLLRAKTCRCPWTVRPSNTSSHRLTGARQRNTHPLWISVWDMCHRLTTWLLAVLTATRRHSFKVRVKVKERWLVMRDPYRHRDHRRLQDRTMTPVSDVSLLVHTPAILHIPWGTTCVLVWVCWVVGSAVLWGCLYWWEVWCSMHWTFSSWYN